MRSGSNPEGELVTNLTGGAGNGDSGGLCHHVFLFW